MKDEPDIIKELREQEKKGKLKNKTTTTEKPEEKQEIQTSTSDGTLTIFEEELKKEENNIDIGSIKERFQTIFENYAVAITIADEKERIVSWNKYAEELFNMNDKDLYLKHVSILSPPNEWKKIRKEDIRQKGMKYKLETKINKKGSEPFDAEISLSVLKGEEGKITGSVGIITDISRLKTAERNLINTQERYKTIFENSAVGIMLTNENEEIISWNNYAEKILGMNENDLYLKPVSSLYPSNEWAKIRSQKVREKGMQHRLETEILRKSDKPLEVDISLSVLKNYEGKIVGSIGVIKDISERKKMEKKLAYERDLLQSLLDNIPDSIYFKDQDSKFIKVNKAKASHSKVKPEEMSGKTDYDFLPEEYAKEIHEDDKKVMQTGKPIINKIEKTIYKNGEERLISVIKIPRFNDEGEIIGTMGISRDVTDLKKAEEIVRKSEKKYRNLFESAIDPIIVLDKKGNFVDVNKQVTELLGYGKKELIGKKFDKIGILSEDSISKTTEGFNKRMTGEEVPPYEISAITKNGEIIPAEVNASPLYEGNEIVGDLIILRDLRERTTRETVEKELIESEKKFRDIFDATGDFLLYLDTNGNILDINNSAINFGNLDKEKIIGKTLKSIKKIFSVEDIDRHIKAIEEAAKGNKVKEYESELAKENGTKYRFLFSTDIIQENGKVNAVLFRGRDITQRQRAWDELVKLEEKYRVLAETSADGVITIDPLGRLTYVNPSFEKMCGRRKSQILATLFREYLSDDSIYLFQQVFMDTRKKDEKIENVELELVNADEIAMPIEVNIAPLKKEGEFGGMICTLRDITERKRVEDELKKSERLKTEFMNIAAHELKSPVTPIKGYLDLIIQDKKASDEVKNWAKISLRNAERLLKLVNDILDVSRLDTDTMRFDMEKINPVDILNEIAEDMRPAIEQKGLEFITVIPKNLPPIMGDRYRLSQVLKNLVGNAIKFTDNGSIALVAKKDQKHLYISIEDSGIGISKNELKKVFTKFYQAYTGDDRKNEGTGLGLFICREIVINCISTI